VLALVELGLTGYLCSFGNTPSQFSFVLFSSIWSLFVLAYVGLTPAYYDWLFDRMVALGLEAVTFIFWFAGSLAIAVYIPASASCQYNASCHITKAATALGFVLWVAFTALAATDGLEVVRTRRGSGGPPEQPTVAASGGTPMQPTVTTSEGPPRQPAVTVSA